MVGVGGRTWAADAPPPADQSWPPALPGAVNGTVTVSSPDFLKIPDAVTNAMAQPGAAKFVMAKTAPTVDLAFHADLPNRALNGTGWSAWGDICVASDGKVYSGVGDHGDDIGGNGHTYIYCWDPKAKVLKQIADANKIAGVQAGDPSFSKVHAGIVEAKDRKIYFTCTFNDGGRCFAVKWTDRIPGAFIYQYDPQTGKTKIVGKLPKSATATTLLDSERNILYCCMEGRMTPEDIKLKKEYPSGATLGAFYLGGKVGWVDRPNGTIVAARDIGKPCWLYESPWDAVVADRNIALDKDGAVYFNGKGDQLWKYDPESRKIATTGVGFPKLQDEGKESQPTMRSSTVESKDGWIYGTTMAPGRLFKFRPSDKKLELLGPDFLASEYTTVTVLSPDERFVYYLPGAHGGAFKIGTPVVQYEIATGTRKVLAFLQPVIEKTCAYVPSGTYGVKLSADGSTLYVNFNGHARNDVRPKEMAEIGFGLTAFAAIHIPASER